MSALRIIAGTAFAENSHNLLPINQIEKLKNESQEWRSTGEESAFLIQFRFDLRPGWYMVSQKLALGSGTVSQLYFDMGEGFCEENSISQKLKPNKVYKRLVYLKSKPKAVKFHPTNKPSKFTIETLSFTPVTQQFATSRLLKRILNHRLIPDLSNETQLRELITTKAKAGRQEFVDVLYRYYEQTHLYHDASDPVSYGQWLRKYENTLDYHADTILSTIESFTIRPKISIILSLKHDNEMDLRKALDSIVSQSYSNWEICIADLTEQYQLSGIINEYQATESKKRIHYNKCVLDCSNPIDLALSLATGEFVAELNHNDELSPHALYFMVKAVNQNPSAEFFYSDEDKLDEEGRRKLPFFKPNWNQDLLYSYNYIRNFAMLNLSLVRSLGGFNNGEEENQNYDLFLRASKALDFENIIHVPRVLYHSRILCDSLLEEKEIIAKSGVTSLQNHFKSLGKEVAVSMGEFPNTYRVSHPIPDDNPLVSLIIPTRDMLEVLKPCVESILEKTEYENYEIIIVDNQSCRDETHAWFTVIETHPKIKILQYNEEFNYSAINNYAVERANGTVVGLINNDVEIINGDWLSEMLAHAIRPDIGCVGAKLLYSDNTVQHAGVVLGLGETKDFSGLAGHILKGIDTREPGYFNRAAVVQNYSAVTAACLLIKKELFQKVGGLEENNLKVAFNDVDFCLNVREAGYRNLWTPYALLYHYESKSRGKEDTPEKQIRAQSEIAYMKLKWSDMLRNDPAYNCNLTLMRDDCGLKG